MTKKTFIILSSLALVLCFSIGSSSLVEASEVEGTINTGVESGVGSMDGVVKQAPTASPVAGTYTSTQSVTLTAAGSTKICYTIDGSTTPSCATSTTCTAGTALDNGGTVSVASTTTIKSIACYADASSGSVSTDTYTISTTSSGSTPPSSGTTTPAATTPTSTTGEVTATVSEGGVVSKLSDDGGEAQVTLPANAVASATTITVTPTTKVGSSSFALISGDKSVVGDYVYNFTAVSGTTAVTTFNKAVTVTLTYTDAQIAGLAEGTLKIYYWDDSLSEWVALADSAVNAGANTVTATTTHFTYFAIMGTQESVTELVDGDVARIGTAAEVYIIKIVGSNKYKRHIVSPEVFNSYGHLSWSAIKSVSSLDDYSLSAWVRDCTGPNETPAATDKVYEVNADSTMHWLNMTAAQFYARGGSDEAIYNVNAGELGLYTLGVDVLYQ